MALAPRDVPVTRDDVAQWYEECKRGHRAWKPFLTAKIAALNLPDTVVNTRAHENLHDETSIVDMILMDMDSYA